MKKETKRNTLDKFKLKTEDAYPKRYISPNVGKNKARKTSLIDTVKKAVTNFAVDTFYAIKEIIRRVM
jgi:hypothetical protein